MGFELLAVMHIKDNFEVVFDGKLRHNDCPVYTCAIKRESSLAKE